MSSSTEQGCGNSAYPDITAAFLVVIARRCEQRGRRLGCDHSGSNCGSRRGPGRCWGNCCSALWVLEAVSGLYKLLWFGVSDYFPIQHEPTGFYNRDLTLYSPVVTICTASLTFNNSRFCPHTVFMCFVWIWEQTAIISLYNINWLVFITEI